RKRVATNRSSVIRGKEDSCNSWQKTRSLFGRAAWFRAGVVASSQIPKSVERKRPESSQAPASCPEDLIHPDFSHSSWPEAAIMNGQTPLPCAVRFLFIRFL